MIEPISGFRLKIKHGQIEFVRLVCLDACNIVITSVLWAAGQFVRVIFLMTSDPRNGEFWERKL